MPNAAKRAETQQRLARKAPAGASQTEAPASAKKAPAAKVAAKAETPAAETKEPKVKAPSIRNTVITMLNEGKSTKEISDVLVAQFPGTKAAEKPSKHIAFYRSRMKKDAATPATA